MQADPQGPSSPSSCPSGNHGQNSLFLSDFLDSPLVLFLSLNSTLFPSSSSLCRMPFLVLCPHGVITPLSGAFLIRTWPLFLVSVLLPLDSLTTDLLLGCQRKRVLEPCKWSSRFHSSFLLSLLRPSCLLHFFVWRIYTVCVWFNQKQCCVGCRQSKR